MTLEQIKRLFKHPTRIVPAIIAQLGKRLPDSWFLRMKYYEVFGKRLNLKNPKTFNEKLQWLKLHDRNPMYTTMVDKVEAKKWVAECIGEEYIVPTLGIWNNADDIDFDKLPDQFVLKCNHNSGRLYICRDKSKLDIPNVRRNLRKWLKQDWFLHGREWPYKNVKRRILAEKMLPLDVINDDGDIADYKFMCFNGKVKYLFVVTERHSDDGLKVTIFDTKWNKMPFTRHCPASEKTLLRPKNYDKMIELAEKLASGIRFLRVDFYEVNNSIFWGELTFFPGCGFEEFVPEEWDERLGKLIVLSPMPLTS